MESKEDKILEKNEDRKDSFWSGIVGTRAMPLLKETPLAFLKNGITDNSSIFKTPNDASDIYFQERLKQLVPKCNESIFTYKRKNKDKDENQYYFTSNHRKDTNIHIIYPIRGLDAPIIRKNYQYHILDWSTSNIVIIAFDDKLYKYDVENRIAQKAIISDNTYDINYSIDAVKVSKNGTKTAVGYANGNILILNARNDYVLKTYNLNSDIMNENNSDSNGDIIYPRVLCWSGQHICCGTSSGHIIIYNTRHDFLQVPIMADKHDASISTLVWNKPRCYLVSGDDMGNIKIWESRQRRNVFSFKAHNSPIKALAFFSKEENHFITGGLEKDRTIKIWNCINGRKIKEFKSPYPLCRIFITKNDKYIITLPAEKSSLINAYSYPDFVKKKEFTGHYDSILDAMLKPDEDRLVTIGRDEIVYFFDITNDNEHKIEQDKHQYTRQYLKTELR